jgi:hypothetical protein
VLRAVYEETGRRDGYVSLEVSPFPAHALPHDRPKWGMPAPSRGEHSELARGGCLASRLLVAVGADLPGRRRNGRSRGIPLWQEP